MPKKYTEEKTREVVEEALKDKIALFYRREFLNWKGNVVGNPNLPYAEVIAKVILDACDGDKSPFEAINKLSRNGAYRMEQLGTVNAGTNQAEKAYAMGLWRHSREEKALPILGRVLQYEVPLKNVRADSAGKIDLLTAPPEGGLCIVELKFGDNQEGVLRCAAEIETYYRQLVHSKLLEEYKVEAQGVFHIRKAVLIPEGGSQHRQLIEASRREDSAVLRLLSKLQIEVVVSKAPTTVDVCDWRSSTLLTKSDTAVLAAP